jgi:urease accessory protein UreF
MSEEHFRFLREHIDTCIQAQEKAVDARFEAQEKAVAAALAAAEKAVSAALSAADRAVSKAETATEKRFENSNEWRNTVETLQRTYTPRTEVVQTVKAIEDKLAVLQKMVYVGLGIVLAFQFFLGIVMAFMERWK